MKLTFLVRSVFLLLFISCTSTKIISSWKDEATPTKNYHKIVVLGLIRKTDRTLRQEMETHLVENLKRLGYDAVSSYNIYGPKAFEGMDEKTSIDTIKNRGAEAVLTIVLLDKTKERYYTPGRVYYSPYFIYYNRFWGYYTTLYDRIYTPGYYTINTKYFWESNLYDLETRKLLYSIQTQSFDPSSADEAAKEYAKIIVDDMLKNKMLQKR